MRARAHRARERARARTRRTPRFPVVRTPRTSPGTSRRPPCRTPRRRPYRPPAPTRFGRVSARFPTRHRDKNERAAPSHRPPLVLVAPAHGLRRVCATRTRSAGQVSHPVRTFAGMRSDLDNVAAELAVGQYGLISRSQARARDIPRGVITRRLAAGRWIEERPGVYAMAGAPNSYERQLLAAVLFDGRAV